MFYAFSDYENLYLVTDLVTGGDLRYHLNQRKTFTEQEAKFLIACILVGLEYMHNNGVIHRDIKPENLLMDELGYVHITDMGISKMWSPDNANDTSGTPGYMAPEVMCRQNHGVAVDYFALGVVCYELMFGKRPYGGKTRKDIRDSIIKCQINLRKSDVPEGWTMEAADFINKTL
jgi:serine/threonine protein kinase